MTKTYKKPVVSIDTGMAEGVYAASGQGTLNVTYHGVWDRWGTNGGKGLAMADWSGINGTITLNITFSNKSADDWYPFKSRNQHRRSEDDRLHLLGKLKSKPALKTLITVQSQVLRLLVLKLPIHLQQVIKRKSNEVRPHCFFFFYL